MSYYTSLIPPTLAEKLKEKGMPIANVTDSITGEKSCRYTYAHIFDWLMETREKSIAICESIHCDAWFVCINGLVEKYAYDTWHEAADAAIEKALELL